MARGRRQPIPLTIVTGARGAGKTTLINRLIDLPAFANTAVILNDFGDVELQRAAVAAADDGYIALGSGCVCCAVRGALVDGLEGLLRDLDNGRVAAVGRVVIEAADAADPAAIVAAVERHPYLSLRFVADGIVAVVDASTIEGVFASRADTVRQVVMADVVALTRGTSPLPVALNPYAVIVDAGTVAPSALVGHRAFDVETGDVDHWLTAPASEPRLAGEAGRIRAFGVTRPGIIPLSALDRFIDYLAVLQGPNLIRVRGAVSVGDGEAVIVEGIGGSFRPPVIVGSGAVDQPAARFAIVAHDLDRETFESYLGAFLNEARIDTPDRDALIGNPLAIAGFSARSGR